MGKILVCLVWTTCLAEISARAADTTSARLGTAVTVLHSIMGSEHHISMDQLNATDCVVVIPGFKKAAAVVGIGRGRGFISCRTASGWSAPGAVSLESGSLGVQVGGEKIDIVILSMDKTRRKKLLSDRFTIGSDASAAWGNGKSAHTDPDAKVLFFAHTKGFFAGFGLDGATLKPDESTLTTIYGKPFKNVDVVEGGTEVPAVFKPFLVTLTRDAER
jgi:lipid-binding SYLF domain-containing protein